jgi:hypothetical protein
VNSSVRAVKHIIFGEAAFLFFMGISVTLHPGYVLAKQEGGISEYGLHVKTAVLYTLAWVILAYCNTRAARHYADGDTRSKGVRKLLLAYSVASLFVLVSTYFYSLNAVLKYIHYGFGAILIVFMSAASLWLFRQLPATSWTRTFLYVQVLGSFAALLSIAGVVHVLFFAESLSNIGCALLLIRTCRRHAHHATVALSPAPLRPAGQSLG